MTLERAGQRELAELVPDHVLVDEDGNVLLLSTPSLLTYAAPEDAARREAIWEWFGLEEKHREAGVALDEELRRRREAKRRKE